VGGVVAEQLLHLAALFALDAAVDHDDRFLAADQAANLDGEVVERVAVLGEDDELALPAIGIAHLGRVLQQLGEFVPLAVLAGVHDLPGLLLQAFEDDDLGFEFLDGLRGRGLIDDGFLEVFVVVWRQRIGGVPNVVGDTLPLKPFGPTVSARDCPRWRSFSSSTLRLSLLLRRLSDW
jgi:hypothetical protein